MRCSTIMVSAALVLACKAADDGMQAPADAGDGAQPQSCAAQGPVAVELQTEDGVTLEADFYPGGTAAAPGVVLLHMIPPGNDKSNYTPEFIAALTDAGFTVLNVNRRGAGNSGGEAEEAYTGDKGRLDAVAAHAFLTGSACAVPPGSIAVVGASNGTTTALDFTLGAAAADRPAALVFLSPGGYTETQNTMSDNAAAIAALPLFVGYPDSERDWPEGIRSLDTGTWTFHEYEGGQHGTRLFGTHPESVGEITDFLKANLAPE